MLGKTFKGLTDAMLELGANKDAAQETPRSVDRL